MNTDEVDIETFNVDLEQKIAEVSEKAILIVTGDANSRIRNITQGESLRKLFGKYKFRERKERSEILRYNLSWF